MASHQVMIGVSFGITSGVITALGMIVGLDSATSSRLAVAAGIVVMAVGGGLADAAGMHLAEEAEIENGKAKHVHREVWTTTFFTFIGVAGSVLTFVVPILIFPLKTAVYLAIGWGMLLLVFLNLYTAKVTKENAVKLISEHIFLALFVVFASYWAGTLVAILLR
jgi:VIT1/CCC1 family predicted Fe2+/Mn2+ transporter